MMEVPKGLRLHIAFFGNRNVGKSSLLNALAGQNVAIVSDTPGTTTDPVEKTLEIARLGPVVLLDTAGIDDEGALGEQRVERTLQVMRRVDMALLVTDGAGWGEHEAWLAGQLHKLGIPFALVRNKADMPGATAAGSRPAGLEPSVPVISVSARSGQGLDELCDVMLALVPERARKEPPLLNDLLPPDGLAVMVVPIDTGAPQGRLILPQVQAIRDCLDGEKLSLVVTNTELSAALNSLKRPPDLVVCDSQVVHEVNRLTPSGIPMTTFSILMARFKGDLSLLARGAAALKRLKPGDDVLIQEACSHHPQKDDIGRIKLPRLLCKLAGGELNISVVAGKEFTFYPQPYKAVVHCGGCVITRGQMLARIRAAAASGCPITNYGMAISMAQGVLQRTLSPFPEALRAFEEELAAPHGAD